MKTQSTLKYHSSSLEEVLLAFRKKITNILQKEASDLKCPVSHIDTLLYIVKKGNPSMKEIADHLQITPPSATAIIETMQKKKLVTRVINEKDRRTIRVTLTSKAWNLFKSLREHKYKIFTKLFSKLHNTEL